MPSAFSTHGKAFHEFQKRLFKSRFFTVSVLIHAIIVMVFGGTVLFNKYVEPPDFTGGEGEGGFVSTEQVTQPPQQQAPPQQPTFTVTAPTNATQINAITTTSLTQATFIPPTLATPVIDTTAKTLAQPAPASPAFSGGMSGEVAKGIAGFSGGWAKGGSGGPGSSLKSRQFEFTAYLAKYAGGDWDSTIWYANVDKKRQMRGSLPNLLWFMSRDSKNKINANPEPEPLDLSSEAIFSKKPPFIFFTGHRDFKLTDKEVENLQKYIRLGGCIWGDSSVPGRRSRFDVAFRREMRRVVPDVDKDFEPLPANHDIFMKGYHPEIRQVPQGINFYTEPVYALKIYGEVAVIYTANDYGDMWQFGLNDKGEFEGGRDENNAMVAMNETLYNLRGFYVRNIEPQSVMATYKFGTNLIIHLLTRWEDKVRNVPKSL